MKRLLIFKFCIKVRVTSGHGADRTDVARLTPSIEHLFRARDPAIFFFSDEISDETEKMFLLLVLLYTELETQDVRCCIS